MPIKFEDVGKALDIDPEKYEDVKAFVEDFGKEWKRAKDVPSVSDAKGKWNNVLRGQLKKLSKEHELDLEVKDKDGENDIDPVDYLPEIAKRITSKNAATIADLTEKLKGNVPEAAAKELEKKLHAAEQSAKDKDTLLTGLTGKYEGLQKSVELEKAKMWEDNQWENAVSKVKWKQGMSDFEKKGFLADQRTKYRIAKDDKGEARTTDADGNPIVDPTKPAKFRGLDELLIDNAKAAKLYEVHEKGGQRVNNVVLRTDTGAQPPGYNPDGPVRRLHPSMQQ